MFKNLFLKTLYDKRWFLLGWSLGIVAMINLTLAFFPSLSQSSAIEQLFSNIPKQLQGLLGDLEAYRTIGGYIGSAVFDLRVPLIALPMAIILGIGLGVGEENNEQLYQLLARPISRASIILQKWFALLFILFIIHVTGFLSIFATVYLIHDSVGVGLVFNVIVLSFLLCVAVGSLGFMLGFATGKKSLATAITALLAFGSYLVTSFASQVSWLKQIDYASLFHYYRPTLAVKNGLNVEHVVILIGVSFVSVVIAIIAFSRRDVGLSS